MKEQRRLKKPVLLSAMPDEDLQRDAAEGSIGCIPSCSRGSWPAGADLVASKDLVALTRGVVVADVDPQS